MSDIDVDEEEWSLDRFMAECDALVANPPAAPDGLELVECDASPRHWPTYVAHVDGQYPAPCMYCVSAAESKQIAQLRCERDHRRWKSWRIWGWVNMKAYVLGLTAGGGVSYGRCEHCGVGRQQMRPSWRGKRPYILGIRREAWACARRGHRHQATSWGLCSVCAPCPSCGSTNPNHAGDCNTKAPTSP